MKKLLFLFLLLTGCAWAQGVRYDAIFPTTSNQTPPYLLATPGITVHVCAHPANVVPCTNYVTTYTSVTLGTPCSNGAQIVLQGTSTCVSAGDAQGNMGFWIAAGTYDYTVCTPTCYGPFVITLGASGGGGSGLLNLSPLNVSITCSPGCSSTFTPISGLSTDFKLTLTSNVTSSTFVTSGLTAGSLYTFHIQEDGSGGRTFTWPANVLGGITIDASAVASTTYIQTFMWNGSNLVALTPGVVYP